MGFSVLYLRPREKMPIEAGWTKSPNKTWEELKSAFHEEYNIGVRLGEPSLIDGAYLTCLDVDIKTKEARPQALQALAKITGGRAYPEVRSGRGFGSRHLYGLTPKPFKMVTFEKHPDWEIVAYSRGRQTVLPPSIHPITGKAYRWERPIEAVADIPRFEFGKLIEEAERSEPGKKKKSHLGTVLQDFEVETVQLEWLDVADTVKAAIIEGANVIDRSAYLMTAAHALMRAGCGKNEILTILTEPDYFLGECAYEHAQTKSRRRAAEWLWRYTVEKIMREGDPKVLFGAVPIDDDPKPLSPDAMAKQAKSLIGDRPWQQELSRDKNGRALGTLVNVHLILGNAFGPALFKFNQFSKLDEIWQATPWGAEVGTEFQERDIQKIKLWMANNFGFQAHDSDIWSALINIADQNAYHPIKEYLSLLPPHDGVARLDFFLEKYLRGEAPTKYMRAVSRKTIVAMVARVFEPGIKFDTMLVLEGVQGLRKSTAIEVLTSKPWFTDVNLNLRHKDSIADMAGKWVLEQGEMNVMSNHEVAELKQFLSRSTDRMRPSYGRKSQDYPRQSVFIGTTNEDIYLKDTSGSRRFWPIRVMGECDVAAIKRDRDQLFAEALAFYRAGEPIWISDAETNHLALKQQEERETSDELISVIEDWLEDQFNKSDFDEIFDPDIIHMPDLFITRGPFSHTSHHPMKMDQNAQKRVASCLRKLGYERKPVWDKVKMVRKWVKLPVKTQSIPVGVMKKDEQN